MLAITKSPVVIKYIDSSLKKDTQFLISAVSTHPKCIQFLLSKTVHMVRKPNSLPASA